MVRIILVWYKLVNKPQSPQPSQPTQPITEEGTTPDETIPNSWKELLQPIKKILFGLGEDVISCFFWGKHWLRFTFCRHLRGRWLSERLRTETEGDNKLLLFIALRFYPLSSKSRLRSILPLPPKEEARKCVFDLFPKRETDGTPDKITTNNWKYKNTKT